MDTKVCMKKATEVGVEVEDGIQFSGCRCSQAILTGYETKFLIDEIVDKSGFTRLNSYLNRYPGEGSGFVYLCALAESHLVVATWPEKSGVRIYLSSCNYAQNNRGKAEFVLKGLQNIFKPGASIVMEARYWSW